MDMMYFKRRMLSALIVMALILLIFNFNCGKKTEPDQVVLAKVGDKVITAKQFRNNYEFGLPHLKNGPNPKESYLNYMINEELLALSGYSQGLDQTERIRDLENELTEELLVEQLFKKEVKDKVTVTPEEIKEAIMKSHVKWKLRYWVEPSLDYANSVCQAMRTRGYGEVVDDILKSNPEINIEIEDFTTDYMTWLDVPPEVLNAIKDLPAGEISDPVEMNGAYFIFQLIDIRREPLSEYDIQTKTHSYKNILSARKGKKRAAEFVSTFMTRKNVITKRAAFEDLSKALIEWHKKFNKESKNFIEAVQSTDDANSALHHLKNNLDKTLITFKNGQWSIKDFLDRFNENSVKLDSTDIKGFRAALNQQIALKIRNHFFSEEARERDLQKTPAVRKELQMWRDKWVYQEAKKKFTENLTVDDARAKQYFAKFKDKYKTTGDEEPTFDRFATEARHDAYQQRALALLAHKVDSLKTHYPVSINYAVLDTIQVSSSKQISMQVFKQSSGRLARPIVDPSWIMY